jgi:methanogenic corrinoid protein MtbC1
MVADLLTLDGWRTVYLGANLPSPSILKALGDHRADLVGISASMPYHVNPVATLVSIIRDTELPVRPSIMVGGLAFNRVTDLWRQIGADGYAVDGAEAVQVARRLVGLDRLT